MDTIYTLQGIEFEWDGVKAQSNIKRHGITFEEAASVFLDPFYQEGDATRGKEQRSFVMGYSLTQNLLITIYVERGERIRVISARAANRQERRFYEDS